MVCIIKKCSVVFLLLYNFPSYCAENKPNTDPLEKLDELLARIPTDEFLQHITDQEKRKFLKALFEYNKDTENSPKNSEGSYHFEPRQPAPLTNEQKTIPIHERIKKKFIGDLPGRINDLIFYFSNQELCLKNNKSIYNRILLHGQPGTGKSHLVKVLAEELQVPYFYFPASFFADKYIGETSKKIRAAFACAKNLKKPVIIFIDEIDGLASKRKDNTHDEQRASLVTLLTEMQDLQQNKNIFIFVATNDLKALDPAIKDRFAGSICEIKPLTLEERAAMFKKAFKEHGITIEDNFAKRLAEVTNTTTKDEETKNKILNFSNRDIESIATTVAFRQFAECHKDKANCNKHLCHYARKVIDETGKKASFTTFHINYEFCEGI